MISDKLFDFLSEFLGYNCRNPKEFNELLPTLDSLDKMDLVYRLEEKFNISIENLVTIGMVVITVTGMWYSLQEDIQLAKELPEPEVSRTEYDLKDQLIRETIINTQEKVQENGEKLEDIDQKLFEIITKD